jgi:folate-dependent phosphoribosylglycinamide formyltransferase PurN
MKALQMAANAADTGEKKAEIERRLKQLREQQRELLADVDRLKQKSADSAPAGQKQALDDAREKARQAGEQLEEKKLGDALAAGTRARETLEELHDDFRETSAAKLAGQLRDLRQDARELEQRQRQLAENAPPAEAPGPNRLSDTGNPNAEAGRQREDYQKLVDALQKTAGTAERAEPLVAKDLAEALRQADQSGIAKALENTGRPGDEQASRQATEGISKLTREIESAAERILGNEAQALRYSRDELSRLAEQAGAKPGDGGKPAAGQGKAPGDGKAEGQGQGEGKGEGQNAGNQPGEGNGPGQGGGIANPRGGTAITGDGYEEWRDRLADLEAVVTDPNAQSALARARRAGIEMRKDFKRHSKQPDPERIQTEILDPLAEAAGGLDARLRELDREDPLAPVSRDPVPDRYAEIVRRYFEELGE